MSFLSNFQKKYQDTKDAVKNTVDSLKTGAIKKATGLKYYALKEFGKNKDGVERRQKMLLSLTSVGLTSFKDYENLKEEQIFETCAGANTHKKAIQEYLIKLSGSENLTDTQKEILNVVTMIGSQGIKGEPGNYKAAMNSNWSGACVMYSKFTGKAYDKSFSSNIKSMKAALDAIKNLMEENNEKVKGMFEEEDKTACEEAIKELDNLIKKKLDNEFNAFKDSLSQTEIAQGEISSTEGGRKSKKARKGRKGRRTKNKRKRQTKKKRGKKRH